MCQEMNMNACEQTSTVQDAAERIKVAQVRVHKRVCRCAWYDWSWNSRAFNTCTTSNVFF
jgi:hypothetical protein